jgi:hypothetical protein
LLTSKDIQLLDSQFMKICVAISEKIRARQAAQRSQIPSHYQAVEAAQDSGDLIPIFCDKLVHGVCLRTAVNLRIITMIQTKETPLISIV